MVIFHTICHLIEALSIVYLIIANHQTKQMLVHLARTLTSVDKHLGALVDISKK